ncbi:hypothetical protein [Pseudoalteromonas apostichopi]|uniref:hypothetical protein n=1 Tax=Pseudoalteromonas apostichopi TaxID=3035452 RepID=UPI002572BE90|nr:hypothetical protein [Pseudoalteromonas sp. FE4]
MQKRHLFEPSFLLSSQAHQSLSSASKINIRLETEAEWKKDKFFTSDGLVADEYVKALTTFQLMLGRTPDQAASFVSSLTGYELNYTQLQKVDYGEHLRVLTGLTC